MTVKAKFVCESAQNRTDGGEGKNVTLRAVTTGSEENKHWSKYTPSGYIQMSITNPSAEEAFKQGSEYYVTFEEA